MKTTLKDIADDTGYSVSTVSRALNGSDKISTKTKDKILESAQKFEYQTPKSRNTQISTQVLNIALIASGFHEGEFYISFFNGLNRAAKKNNIRLFLSGIVDPEYEVANIMEEITLNYYDGAILYIPEFRRDNYEELSDWVPPNFPIVSNALIENPVFSTITFDGYSGGYLAARHFEKQSYTRLGLIQGPFERAESRYRNNGFKDYIQQRKELELSWVYNGDFTFEAGVKAFEQYKKIKDKPRAIFAGNDDMANGFMESGKAEGLEFPQDVAVIGYDDLPVCRHNHPTMSSIKTDYQALGMATMKRLRNSVDNPDEENNLLSFVSVSVVQRESS